MDIRASLNTGVRISGGQIRRFELNGSDSALASQIRSIGRCPMGGVRVCSFRMYLHRFFMISQIIANLAWARIEDFIDNPMGFIGIIGIPLELLDFH